MNLLKMSSILTLLAASHTYGATLCGNLSLGPQVLGQKSLGSICIQRSANTDINYVLISSPLVSATRSAVLSESVSGYGNSNEDTTHVLREAGWIEFSKASKGSKVYEGKLSFDLVDQLEGVCPFGGNCQYIVRGKITIKSIQQKQITFAVIFQTEDEALALELLGRKANDVGPIDNNPVEVKN